MHQDNEEPTNGHGVTSKRIRYGPNMHSSSHVQTSDSGLDSVSANGVSPKGPLLDSDLTPVEKMIAMICALVAEGERGAESLEILISQIHPDLLADIIVTNMKQFSKIVSPPMGLGNLPVSGQTGSSSSPAPAAPTTPMQPSVIPAHVPFSSAAPTSVALSDNATVTSLPADSKRDPRRVNLQSVIIIIIVCLVNFCMFKLQIFVLVANTLLEKFSGSSSAGSTACWSTSRTTICAYS